MNRRAQIASVGALAVLCAASRLPALRDLPIFSDEAMYLRLARLIRSDPLSNLWLPLNAPTAPLHSWLLARFLPLDPDPVRAGRLLSVLCGAFLVAALAWTLKRCDSLLADRAGNGVAAMIAAALLVASPFFAFSDRLARVDALFALEVALAAGLSVDLASRARRALPLFVPALAFGALLGFTMLTRQAVSYSLWLLPAIAFALVPGEPGGLRRLAGGLTIAAAMALVLWVPMLVAPAWPDLMTRIFHRAGTRPSLGAAGRLGLLVRNLGIATQSLWTYLTPPVFLASLGAGVWLALSGRRRLLAYLASWEGLLVAPTVLFVGEFFPRYALPAALPLIAAAAFGFAALWQRAKAETAALLVAVAAWGVIDIWRGERDWTKWRLLPVDRTQFVSGWPAGAASEKAAEFLEARSRERPITVVVPGVSGNPSDAVWLLLDGRPRVRLFHAVEFLRSPILRPVLPPGTVVLRRDVWTGAPPEAVRFAPQEPVFFVCPAPVSRRREGWTPTDRIVAERNPDARFVARFENPAGPEGWVESSVVLFRLR